MSSQENAPTSSKSKSDVPLWFGTEKEHGWRNFRWRYMITIWIGSAWVSTLLINCYTFNFSISSIYLWMTLFPIMIILLLLPVFCVYTVAQSYLLQPQTPADPNNVKKYIKFTDNSIKKKFGSDLRTKVPIEDLQEAYFAEKIDFPRDLLETLTVRTLFSNFRFTLSHLKFFVWHVVPELLNHSKVQDRVQVTDHYDRGNDFFGWFLGETMIYTSAFYTNTKTQTLEEAQFDKLNLICNKMGLNKNGKNKNHFDFGCGWGTLCNHVAKYFGSKTTGITLAQEQIKYAQEISKKNNIKTANFKKCDYRDCLPDTNKDNYNAYDTISCVEMSEHVGVLYFNSFMKGVYDMLKDDGIFYLQIACIRRSWVFEDLVWGLFMDKYVFPGADASTPISNVITELEKVGFEVHSVENVGIHYSHTITAWYNNWKSNKQNVIKSYGERWYRVWLWFLAWSALISSQGRSTCYQVVCHKNKSTFNRNRFIGEHKEFKY